jgi:hypothetical protein
VFKNGDRWIWHFWNTFFCIFTEQMCCYLFFLKEFKFLIEVSFYTQPHVTMFHSITFYNIHSIKCDNQSHVTMLRSITCDNASLKHTSYSFKKSNVTMLHSITCDNASLNHMWQCFTQSHVTMLNSNTCDNASLNHMWQWLTQTRVI